MSVDENECIVTALENMINKNKNNYELCAMYENVLGAYQEKAAVIDSIVSLLNSETENVCTELYGKDIDWQRIGFCRGQMDIIEKVMKLLRPVFQKGV